MHSGMPGLAFQIRASFRGFLLSHAPVLHCTMLYSNAFATPSAREPRRVHGQGTLGVKLAALTGTVGITISKIPIGGTIRVDP